MRKFISAIAIVSVILSSAATCNSRDDITPENTANAGCFADAPLEKISWAKDQLQYFQKPKSGPLRVAVYDYKGESFLVFANVFVSCPACYIFDCSGANITQKGIHYNSFTENAKEVKILLPWTTY